MRSGLLNPSRRPSSSSIRVFYRPHEGMSERTWKRLAREQGISSSGAPKGLDVFDWVAIFRLVWRGQASP